MKKFENLGKSLSKDEQKKIIGGDEGAVAVAALYASIVLFFAYMAVNTIVAPLVTGSIVMAISIHVLLVIIVLDFL